MLDVTLQPDSRIKSVDEIKQLTTIGDSSWSKGVHIASMPCPTITKEGLTAGWRILDGLAKAAALVAAARSLQAAKMQERIGRKYYNLAKEQWDYFYEWYRPLERQELDEVHKTKKVTPDYDKAIKGHDCSDTVFSSSQDHKDKLYSQFCICIDKEAYYTHQMALSTVRGDSHNFARRYAEAQADKLDDVRWNRKMQAAARGRGLLPQSTDFATKAAGLFGQYSQAMSGFVGQAMQFSGWIRNRHQTVYNGEHTNRVGVRYGDGLRPTDGAGFNYNTAFSTYGTEYGRGGLSYEDGMRRIQAYNEQQFATAEMDFYSANNLTYDANAPSQFY